MKEISKYSFLSAVSNFLIRLLTPFLIIFFIEDLRIKIGLIGIFFAVETAAEFLTSIPFNWVGDKFMRKPLMILGSFGSGFVFFMFTRITHVNQIFFLLLLAGAFGGISSVSSGFFADLTRGADRGKKSGFFSMFVGLAGAAAIVIGARAIELFGFTYMFYIAAGDCIFEGLALLFINPKKAATE